MLTFAQRLNRKCRERWRERRKRGASELSEALQLGDASEQAKAAEIAQAEASLASAEADVVAQRATLRGDSKQQGIGAFCRSGTGSSESL